MDKIEGLRENTCTKCGGEIKGLGLQSKIVNGKLVHIKCPEGQVPSAGTDALKENYKGLMKTLVSEMKAKHQAHIEALTEDCEALNELLRERTGMGQGEIDSDTEDIKETHKGGNKHGN